MRILATVTFPEVQAMLEKHLGLVIARPTIYHYMKNKNFPESVKLGHPLRWRKRDVEDWIEKHIEG